MEDIKWEKHLYLWCKMKGYSMENTFTVYRSTLRNILQKFPALQAVPLIEIQEYAASITNDNTRKNTCVLLRWAFNTVLHKPIDWRDLPYPKRKQKIQPIYSEEEAIRILNATKSPKQKAIIALIIDCGLRISEPCAIYLTGCNCNERRIILRSAKGGNDRTVYPSQYVWDLMHDYIENWHTTPKIYLFEGQTAGMPYTTSSIRQFIERSCGISGVQYKKVHSFRRFAITWQAENGVPLSVIAEKSGHKSTKTIERHYINHSASYMRDVVSPLSIQV